MGILNVAKKLFKKRTSLAILLTVVFMLVLKGFYRERIFELSFDVKTSEPLQLQIYYSQAWNVDFNEKKSITKKIEASSDYEQVKIKLPINLTPRLKLGLNSNTKALYIKDLKLNNISLDLKSSYFNEIDEYSFENGALLINSVKKASSLAFENLEKPMRRIEFHFEIFIILLFFTFLINYKLVQYMVRLKLDDDNSRLDIIFLALFFVGIFVPMTNLSDEELSEKENRMLAKYIPLFNGDTLNPNFGSDFENYFNDRFFGRDFLMNVDTKIKSNINEYFENAKAFRAKDNWIFAKWELKKIQFNKMEEEAILTGVDNYIKFCKDNNIACYIEIAPARALFALDKYDAFGEKEDYMFLDFQEKIKEKMGTKFIYPYEEMLEADKSDYVYFKTDHHWTEWGVYAGYKALIKEIQKDFKDVPLVSESDFDIFYDNRVRADFTREFWKGHTANLLNSTEKKSNLDTDYKYYTHKNEKALKIDINEAKYDKLFHYPEGANYNVVLLGTSSTENFSALLPYSFKNVKKLRANNRYGNEDNQLDLYRWKEEILDFKPDIMIILISKSPSMLSTIKEVK